MCCCLGQSGEIARHLEFVSHSVRTKLDELKRKEVERLQAAIREKQHIKDGRWNGTVGGNLIISLHIDWLVRAVITKNHQSVCSCLSS